MIKVQPAIKNYAWGKVFPDGEASRFSNRGPIGSPVAELWYGVHSSGCSMLEDGSHLDANLGVMLKVLSAKEALSIQVHPDEVSAKALHSQDPSVYVDANAKHEAAIALTEVELLHGFRNNSDILDICSEAPELSSYLNKNGDIVSTFRSLLSLPQMQLESLNSRISERVSANCKTPTDYLVKSLLPTYGLHDLGYAVSYLLSYKTLAPGEFVYTPPGVVHAYLKGDLVECLTSSDNVIRVGFTEKYKDVKACGQVLLMSSQPPTKLVAQTDSSFKLDSEGLPFELSISEVGSGVTILNDSELSSILIASAPLLVTDNAGDKVSLNLGAGLVIGANESVKLTSLDTKAKVFFAR